MADGEARPGISPGAPAGPFFDDDALWRMDEDPATVLTALRRDYGEIFTITRAAAAPRVVLTTGGHIRELAKRDPELRSRGTSQFAGLVGEHSVNMLDGKAHRLMRELLHPPIHGRALSRRVPQIRRIVHEELDRLPPARPVPLNAFTNKIALRVITSVLFSSITDPHVHGLCDVVSEMTDDIHRHRSIPPARRTAELTMAARARFQRQRTRLDRHLSALIATRRAHPVPEPADLLGHLIAAPAALSDHQIRDQLVTMFVAGHLTTAASLAMAAYWLDRAGDHTDEVTAELGTLAADATAADMTALRHLGAFCDETLRMGSVVPHSAARRTTRALTAFGHRLPAGTELIVSIHLAHHRPEIFPDPDVFRPRRFIDDPPRANEFVPFGQGTRRCPGAALATLEMKIFLAELRRANHVKLAGSDIPFRTVSLGSTLALSPEILVHRTGERPDQDTAETRDAAGTVRGVCQ